MEEIFEILTQPRKIHFFLTDKEIINLVFLLSELYDVPNFSIELNTDLNKGELANYFFEKKILCLNINNLKNYYTSLMINFKCSQQEAIILTYVHTILHEFEHIKQYNYACSECTDMYSRYVRLNFLGENSYFSAQNNLLQKNIKLTEENYENYVTEETANKIKHLYLSQKNIYQIRLIERLAEIDSYNELSLLLCEYDEKYFEILIKKIEKFKKIYINYQYNFARKKFDSNSPYNAIYGNCPEGLLKSLDVYDPLYSDISEISYLPIEQKERFGFSI